MAKKELYFLAIIPDEPIKQEVMDLKLELADRYNCKSALKSPPHITLHMPFQWRTDREDQLLDKLGKFEFESGLITVEMKDFDFFDPGVVFVGVAPNEDLKRLQLELVTYIRKEFNLFNANYKDKPFHPHITIGFRDIKKALFPEIKKFYESKRYSAEIKISSYCLLKHNGKSWDEFKYFNLNVK